ncbi:MAG: hypothetical protein OEW15_04075 [Nitrospirota bacterium]|nr:hypothetical protein [Nitrospirota bacterium]
MTQGGGIVMACPFAAGAYMLSCGASQITYVPTRREISEYCADKKYEQYRLCAYYRHAVWNGLTPVSLPKQQERPGE